MPSTAVPPPPHAPAWRELGRAEVGGAPPWTVWVAPLDGCGGALYRTLVVADSAVAVAVDLLPRPGAATQVIYRGRSDLPRHAAAERVRGLLAAAEEASLRAGQAMRRQEGAAAGPGMAPRRAAEMARGGGQGDRPDLRRQLEHRVRERAYFLWEREGRPEGRAEEFWTRACREAAQQAA
jgi:hypothetical protein